MGRLGLVRGCRLRLNPGYCRYDPFGIRRSYRRFDPFGIVIQVATPFNRMR
jgi:hypothetical protein